MYLTNDTAILFILRMWGGSVSYERIRLSRTSGKSEK